MSKKRRHHGASFKATVAPEAIAAEKTLAEASQRLHVHQGMRLSITMDTLYYKEALEEAIHQFARPEIFNEQFYSDVSALGPLLISGKS